ncbi:MULTISPECIES: TadE/TadG family type IV pilus assembly protein [Aeromicrobium]|uniref:TadE/TadG family type IV pilus assembly protein n=1 Tax=Aeromicrobium TaxID=2040 RepID=UPI00257987B9|nr:MULTISPECIES: pilus assembly protein TadG-related protein [Aeromicrobium]
MQLTHLRRRFGLRKKEKGATIVLVTLSMVALLGMAAVSVDFAVASSEKATVQGAADQAVLALATDCSLKKSTCLPSTATWYAQQNAGTTASAQTLKDGVVKNPTFDDGKVTVRVSKNVNHTFAKVLGDASSTVRSEATATWNTVPLVGTKLIPMGLPYCDWLAAQPGSATSPGAMRTYLWARYSTGEASCPGTGATAATVYSKRGTASGYGAVGQAMYFTRSFFPGVNTNCDFSANLWDVYRNMLDDWSLITADTCMEAKLAGVGNGSVVMMPIYAVEKKSVFWGSVSYPSRLVILGFAPFKVDKWVNYPFLYFGVQPSFSALSYTNNCDMKFNFATIGGGCAGVRGQFVRSSEGALFNGFTQYGSFYNNTGSGLSGDAPNLGLTNVKLVK